MLSIFFEPEQFFVFWKGTGLIFNSLKQIMRILIKMCNWSHKKAISANKKILKKFCLGFEIDEAL